MKGIVKGEGNSDYCIGVNKGIRGDVYSNNKVQMRYIVTTFSFPRPMLLIVCTDYHSVAKRYVNAGQGYVKISWKRLANI